MKEGRLYQSATGRWCADYQYLEDGETYMTTDQWTCGEGVEVWTKDGWLAGRFEALNGDYYIILRNGLQFYPMKGTLVRRPDK